MYTIESNIENEIIIKNSRFITSIYKVNTIDEINNILNQIKTKYKDASHYCYAYKIDNIEKSNDDGEPTGTAGLPIMEIIYKNKLNLILIIVTRYFGGIKLGSGGLIRAYSKSANSTLKMTNLIKLIPGKNIDITFKYDKIKYIDYLLKEEIIIKKDYDELIKYNFNTYNNEIINKLENDKDIKTTIIKDIYIEKR